MPCMVRRALSHSSRASGSATGFLGGGGDGGGRVSSARGGAGGGAPEAGGNGW